MWKARERLALDEPMQQLDMLEASGVDHPSSWADTYHQLAPNTVRIKHTFNGMMSWWSGGPWSEALQRGHFDGEWFRYDLRSAYRWAATVGLPDPKTFRATSIATNRTGYKSGIWVATITGSATPTRILPVAFRTGKRVIVTTEDIRTYGLKVDIARGITWTESYPSDYVERTLAQLPFPKEAGRAYWGRWIARDPLVCQTPKSEWQLQNVFANFVWGWLIVHRVRARVWESAKHAAHVYVDEVVVPHSLPVGNGLGDWQLKERYADGISVRRTGWYGARESVTMAGHTMKTGH
jgi:hypothetical protein